MSARLPDDHNYGVSVVDDHVRILVATTLHRDHWNEPMTIGEDDDDDDSDLLDGSHHTNWMIYEQTIIEAYDWPFNQCTEVDNCKITHNISFILHEQFPVYFH